MPHPGLARAWSCAASRASTDHESTHRQPQPLHSREAVLQQSPTAADARASPASPMYSDINAMLAQLHMERVFAGVRAAWHEGDDPPAMDDEEDL
mmetsp:Transcript_9623/g.31970  ORF Transcript_9623/g.31970 Transcript_9623/m.31970 type:complete len:95 (+) Transcript_9623:426-710(+)